MTKQVGANAGAKEVEMQGFLKKPGFRSVSDKFYESKSAFYALG